MHSSKINPLRIYRTYSINLHWIYAILHIVAIQGYDLPPRLTVQPELEIGYKLGESIVIPCKAVGPPTPSYEWKKNGEPLIIDGKDIRFIKDGGSIQIEKPTSNSEGVYQCFAENKLGRAVSVKTNFKMAVLEPFPSLKQPKILRPPLGTPQTLWCHPPKSYPAGLLYWGENRKGSRLKPIENTKRVSLDYNGHLHFANIEAGDSRNGESYVCILHNTVLRSIVQGDDQIVDPNIHAGEARYSKPKIMWSSDTQQLALKDQRVKMKCIFSGFPTPDVTWTRLPLGTQFPPSTETGSSFGQELIIHSPQFEDGGRYRCSANNTHGGQPEFLDFQLTVEASPYWRSGMPPEDAVVEEEDTVHFECLADGLPKPTVKWYINGVPIEDLPVDERRSVAGGVLEIRNVSKNDIRVFQCNASNIHGYILANAYLNILIEPPSFLKTLDPVTKVTVGQSVRLPCKVFGTKPVVSWSRPRDSPNHVQQSSGDLLITSAQIADNGKYTCNAVNKYGSDKASGELIVRERTQITRAPSDQQVNFSSDVVFHCGVTTDPQEVASLKVEWRKNGMNIDIIPEKERYSVDPKDKSLTIRKVKVMDSASYTCHADNGVDTAEASATLRVKDRPDPPYGVRVVKCLQFIAELAWSPGSENNDRITEFIIRTNDSDSSVDRELKRVEGNATEARVQLTPWNDYRFSVTARNRMGESEPSQATSNVCKTPPSEPPRHPSGVCTDTKRGETLLVFKWKPLTRDERYGPNFRYLVSYRRRGTAASEKTEIIRDWTRSELVVGNQPTYEEYEVSVSSENDEGLAQGRKSDWIIGYSGQGVPQIRLENFQVISASMNSTYCDFAWTPVQESDKGINGFFRGYRIQFWKSEKPEEVRHEDIILNHELPCPSNDRLLRRSEELEADSASLINDRLKRQTVRLMRGGTNKLWPHSIITAGILVLNGAHTGAISDTIQFQTPEGAPSAVAGMNTGEKGSNHMIVEWQPPREVNGVLTDYLVTYEADGEDPKKILIYDPTKTRQKISGLKPDTDYTVKVAARTGGGIGAEREVKERTLPASAPSKPKVDSIRANDESAMISWLPVSDESSGQISSNTQPNPGNSFHIEYKPSGSEDWRSSSKEEEGDRSINVTGLETGETYDMRVVATNGEDGVERRTESEIFEVYIGQNKAVPVRTIISMQQFLLIILCAIVILLLLLLIIVCLVRHNQGQKYFVQKSEKRRGYNIRNDNDPAFDEYTGQQEPIINKVATSLDSLEKPTVESDVDSLEDYADPDPGRFNEDGSFIGQYGIRGQQPQQPQLEDQSKQEQGEMHVTAFTTLV